MKMCLAPCTLEVNRDQYVQMMRDALDVLQGKNRETAKRLKEKMQDAAKHQMFEMAAQYRDQLFALQNLTEKQSSVVQDIEDADVIAAEEQADWTSVSVMMIREGKLVGSDGFVVYSPAQDVAETLRTFVSQYYETRYFPPEIILNLSDEVRAPLTDEFQQLYSTQFEHAGQLRVSGPSRGSRADLCKMAKKNAEYQLDEHSRKGNRRHTELKIIQEKLHLSRLPVRMECIDISNLQGTAIVASNVVFIEGKPAKDQYRLYNIKTVENAPDDFQSMREVVQRRLERAVREDDTPDLLVIDGGKGQLSAAQGILEGFPQLPLELVSLAKSHTDSEDADYTRSVNRSEERIFQPGRAEPIVLAVGTVEHRLLTKLRDEAHRFAITHHRNRRGKQAISSELDQIPGVGPKLRQRLLQHFGSIQQIGNASLEELTELPGISERVALSIHAHFRSVERPEDESGEKPTSQDNES
jgi:excinuclease ABC subunit C